MTDFSGIFGKPFAWQLAAWRIRLANQVTTATWDAMWQSAHDRAFTVAGAMKAELLADLAAAVDKAITNGGTLETFRKDFREIVERQGWHGWAGEGTKKGEAWRTKVIYKTNLATSYAAGRLAQLREGGFAFFVYRHGGSREPRVQHLAWDGLVLEADHPFWATHAPPNGWGCSCYITGARSREGAKRVGGQPGKVLEDGWQTPDPKTGAPKGIDRGWAYAPGASVDAEIIGVVSGKLPRLPAEIGAVLFHTVRRPKDIDELTREFGVFLDRSLSTHVERNYLVIGALKPEWVAAARSAGIRPETAEIAVTDRAIQHTFRGTSHLTAPSRRPDRAPKVDPLDLVWYRDLPRHLLAPRAVLVQKTPAESVFILVYDVPGSLAKLVVEIDTPVRKAGGRINVVQSGRLAQTADIKAIIGQGAILIEGKI